MIRENGGTLTVSVNKEKAKKTIGSIWDGSVPLQVEMEGHDETYYVVMRRNDYLPSVLRYTTKSDSRVLQFSYNNRMLQWDIPIGVLYDLFVENGNPLLIQISEWDNTKYIPYQKERDLQRRYRYCLKEALFCEYQNNSILNNQSQQSQDTLFESVQNDDYCLYQRCNLDLCNDTLRSGIPVKVLSILHPTRLLRYSIEEASSTKVYSSWCIQGIYPNEITIHCAWTLMQYPDHILYIVDKSYNKQ